MVVFMILPLSGNFFASKVLTKSANPFTFGKVENRFNIVAKLTINLEAV